jgi:hypothetical protein
MPLKLEVEQSPEVAVATQKDVPATTAVAAVRASLRDVLRPAEMR